MSSDPGAAPGLLLVLSAPSGAGKTTLAHRFRAAHPDAVFSVSATTRAPRGAERDGVDYHFVSPERFAALVAEGALAEWAEVHGQRYGTLRATVEATLRRGGVAPQEGARQGGLPGARGGGEDEEQARGRAAVTRHSGPAPASARSRP